MPNQSVACFVSYGSFFCLSFVFRVYIVLCLIVFGCQYQCSWLPEKTRLWNDLLCVEWDVKPYTLTHSSLFVCLSQNRFQDPKNFTFKILKHSFLKQILKVKFPPYHSVDQGCLRTFWESFIWLVLAEIWMCCLSVYNWINKPERRILTDMWVLEYALREIVTKV